MVSLVLAVILQTQAPERTPAIYRCPTIEAESKRLRRVIEEEGFDSLCVDPKPGPLAIKAAKGNLKLIDAKAIDTKANMKWRDATIAFASGNISPKEWLAKTKNLKETIHFLTSPSTTDLRTVMSLVPVDPGQTYSGRSVFAEMILLSMPGRLCITSSDIWTTRELPDAGRLQSWILAMNDWLGPMLSYRHDNQFLVTDKPKVIRADEKPGLLILRQAAGKKTMTFYYNNSMAPIELPTSFNPDKVTINRGLNVDGPKPVIVDTGFIIEESYVPTPG
jgi:hypothetical protein